MAEDQVPGLSALQLQDSVPATRSEDGATWLESEMLGKTVQVRLSDERVIKGKVACIDHLGNVVLYDSDEFIPSLNLHRALNSIIIPERFISQLEVETPISS